MQGCDASRARRFSRNLWRPAKPETMTIFVRDLMHRDVITCSSRMPFIEAIRKLVQQNREALVVVDEFGRAIGVFGKQEIIQAYTHHGANFDQLAELVALDVMRPGGPEIPPDIPAITAAQLMLDQSLREVYVMHHPDSARPDRPVGLFTLDDVLQHLAETD